LDIHGPTCPAGQHAVPIFEQFRATDGSDAWWNPSSASTFKISTRSEDLTNYGSGTEYTNCSSTTSNCYFSNNKTCGTIAMRNTIIRITCSNSVFACDLVYNNITSATWKCVDNACCQTDYGYICDTSYTPPFVGGGSATVNGVTVYAYNIDGVDLTPCPSSGSTPAPTPAPAPGPTTTSSSTPVPTPGPTSGSSSTPVPTPGPTSGSGVFSVPCCETSNGTYSCDPTYQPVSVSHSNVMFNGHVVSVIWVIDGVTLSSCPTVPTPSPTTSPTPVPTPAPTPVPTGLGTSYRSMAEKSVPFGVTWLLLVVMCLF
jgi:hypothetical protein